MSTGPGQAHRPMNDGAARHFAVRQVNPFEGVLQVVECSDARAYSADGRVWQIQVIAERPDHTWRSVDHAVPVRQFFNFGLWDLRDGLHQVPANPVLDIGAMSDAANRLVETLSGLTERLPFALADHFECWATDAAGEPLALLATTEDRALIGHLRVGEWQASRFTGQGLATPDREAAEHPTNNASMPRGHAGELERRVRDAGRQTTWFDRSDPDRPVRLDGLGEPLAEAACVFPSMGLKTDWPDRQSRRLAADYIDWLAPWLLMLPGLGDDERRHLEHSACRRAVALSTVYPLLPRIMDRDAVEAARVEARLRRAAR